MNVKILGIFVMLLLIATSVLPVYGNINLSKTRFVKKNTGSNDDSRYPINIQSRSFEKVVAEEEWAWAWSNAVYPTHRNVLMTPLVAELDNNMTNGSEIIFITYSSSYRTNGILRAIHGKDGSAFFDVTDINNRTSPPSTPAIGDIDNDGKPEIITLEDDIDGQSPYLSEHLIAFEHDGTWKWTSDSTEMLYWGCPSIADLDEDGIPEIVIGDQVFDNLGHLRATGNAGSALNHSIIANVDDTPGPEIIAGNTIYSYNPSSHKLIIKWQNTSLGDGYNAVGLFDSDPEAEIVLVIEGTVNKLYLLNHTMDTIWYRSLPEASGGPPTIDDYDGDFFPEIGVATAGHYNVFDSNGDILWDSKITDYSSGRRGSTVYDLNCDGVKDVIYSDEQNLTIFDGRDGSVQWRTRSTSITAREYNVVADVDGDDHAEIIVPCTGYSAPNFHGIRVFGNDTNWTCARKIWNQHSYHITNVNDNATIPKIEVNNWEKYNNYRVQNIGNGTPKLCCTGGEGIYWHVKPGTVATRNIQVWNCGDPCSELNWNVSDWPNWGNWFFLPWFGWNLKECQGPTTIKIYCQAPNIPNGLWVGHINISNREDPTNYCLIPVNLTTSKSKTIQSTIIEFLDSHPDMFPILHRLLKMFGLKY